jgi:hypothetical protein
MLIEFVRRSAPSVLRLFVTMDELSPQESASEPTVTAANTPDSAERPFRITSAFTWSKERANVGLALGQLPAQVFVNFDRSEPEWPVLKRLAAWTDRPLSCLTAICLGITDYQLGGGAAVGYWKAVMIELDRRVPSKAADVIELMARICRHPVSARLADQKLAPGSGGSSRATTPHWPSAWCHAWDSRAKNNRSLPARPISVARDDASSHRCAARAERIASHG